MDWLFKYHATIDCKRKSVLFQPLGAESFEFKRSPRGLTTPIISTLQARKMLDSICQGFLAYIVDLSLEDTRQASDIPITRNFLYVSPEDLPGLPPDHEIEFIIELLPGTVPVCKTPYCMAPEESKELKVQLQELLDKGFIRPSHSPWGASVLFVRKKDRSIRLCVDY